MKNIKEMKIVVAGSGLPFAMLLIQRYQATVVDENYSTRKNFIANQVLRKVGYNQARVGYRTDKELQKPVGVYRMNMKSNAIIVNRYNRSLDDVIYIRGCCW